MASATATPAKADWKAPTFPTRPGETSVPITEALAQRWSPYRFHAEAEVEEEDLRGILEAARWAPSSYGEEPWRFIVACRTDPHRKVLEDTLMEGNAYARRAGVLLATMAKSTFTRNGKSNRVALHDVGLATGNLLAEATARGLITHPMGGFDKEALREAFRIPDDFVPVAVIALGHHDPALDDEALIRREARDRRRRSLAETAFGATFGEAYGLRERGE